jgi:hypothetical protein
VLVACTERVDAFRDARPDVPILDIRYLDLLADPLSTVHDVYAFLGEELTPGAATAMRAYMDANPRGRFGAHRYDVTDFGVSAAELRERFSGYLDRYSLETDVTAPTG